MSNVPSAASRLKAVILFQVKLGLDALRDFALSPVSVVCALIDIISSAPKGQGYYDRLLKFGRKTDHWINLFDHPESDEELNTQQQSMRVDDVIANMEQLVKNRVQRGEMSTADQQVVESFLHQQHQDGNNTHSNDDAETQRGSLN